MSDSIANDEIGPAALLEWDERLGIAFYPDLAEKTALISRMSALAAPREVYKVRRGEDAIRHVDRDALILVDPEDEAMTVTFFERNRDHFDDVNARTLILLLRGGTGERALKDAPALASFAREASFEVGLPPTREERRVAFEERLGATPETWLDGWREGAFPDTLENNYVLSEALVLGGES